MSLLSIFYQFNQLSTFYQFNAPLLNKSIYLNKNNFPDPKLQKGSIAIVQWALYKTTILKIKDKYIKYTPRQDKYNNNN